MKLLLSLLLIFGFQSDPQTVTSLEEEAEAGKEIIKKSQQHHDPKGLWSETELSIHIQEPRTGNPQRYSKIILNNKTGYFSLVRDSEIGKIRRLIDEDGKAEVSVNGSTDISAETREEYRLSADRNSGYQRFYQLMYGLPMSLSDDVLAKVEGLKHTHFNGVEVYAVSVELKEPMISKHWELIISKDNYSLLGLSIHSSDTEREGELITFDGQFTFNGISIPRFRHWYEGKSKKYLGSDVIVVWD